MPGHWRKMSATEVYYDTLTTALSALAIGAATKAHAGPPEGAKLPMTEGGGFKYEVTRSEAEWRDMLSTESYEILRMGGTELPRSSPLWDEAGSGMYHCKGCDLPAFDSAWKVPLDSMSSDAVHFEVHCRRCGSHLGHLLPVEGQQVHCINGAALEFKQATF